MYISRNEVRANFRNLLGNHAASWEAVSADALAFCIPFPSVGIKLSNLASWLNVFLQAYVRIWIAQIL